MIFLLADKLQANIKGHSKKVNKKAPGFIMPGIVGYCIKVITRMAGREGLWVSFYNNGKTASIGNYKDGKKDGLWKDFIDNGVLSNVGNFKDGEYEGLWKRFYRNGKLMAKGIYSKGKKVGIWEHRYKDGTLMKTVNWKNGRAQNKLVEYVLCNWECHC